MARQCDAPAEQFMREALAAKARQRLQRRLIGISRTVRPIAESCRCDRLLAPEIATPLYSHIILASRLSQIAKDVFRRAGLYALNGVRVVAIRRR